MRSGSIFIPVGLFGDCPNLAEASVSSSTCESRFADPPSLCPLLPFRYFPTILIVLLAVFNDGAMIALSKDRVVPSHVPNRWNLYSIFVTGIVYGLYLTLSSWVFYYVLTHMTFFQDKVKMFSLDSRTESLTSWCQTYLPEQGFNNPNATVAVAYPQLAGESRANGVTVLDQCVAEQKYVRGSMARAALYVQVSVSGQAVVFVVRAVKHSLMSRAGSWTYGAFIVAQFLSTIIAIFGFNGYDFPPDPIDDCKFCVLSTGGENPFFSKRQVPLANTESAFTASVIGCTYYVVAAWIWAAIWYMGLDPIKWFMFYVLDEEGFRRQPFFSTVFSRKGERMGAGMNFGINKNSAARVSMSRVSGGGIVSGGIPGVGGRMSPSPAMLNRASVVRV